MGRDDSPDYSPPTDGDGWFSNTRRSPVPSSNWSRGRSPGEDRSWPGDRSPRSRDRSPRSRDRSPRSRDRSPRSRERSPRSSRRRERSPRFYKSEGFPEFYRRSRSPDQRSNLGLSEEDEETLRSLYCRRCDVELKDRGSMMAHIKGKEHLKQQKRLQDVQMRRQTGYGMSEVLRPAREVYDEKYWTREKGDMRLRPEQERFLDTSRLDKVKPKFDPRKYDHGQYRRTEELYCTLCDVWVKSRDQMQNHKEGVEHRKRSAKVNVYECKLCHIKVTCQDTLNNHMKGKDHIKRAKELYETRKRRGEMTEEGGGYRTGPLEMKLLGNDKEEELERLRKENSILKRKVQEYKRDREKCVREHNPRKMEELERLVRDQKQEIMDLRASQMNNIKVETLVKSEVKLMKREPGEYMEFKEEYEDDD